ncbi:MAG: peptidylprolyl isomerase [Deltaproteobacteria bacterium]
MQLLRYACLILLIGACEHKNQRDDQAAEPTGQPSPDPSPAARAAAEKAAAGSGTGSGSAAGSAAMAPAGSGAGSGSAVVEAKAPAADGDMTVRAPTAADLATYTADLKGNGKLTATFDTSMGTIHCQLFADKAPLTVANFVGLARGKKAFNAGGKTEKKPFYDGLTFHRVIPGFMIQGGDPEGSGRGGPGYQFQNELAAGEAMEAGTLAMANAGKDTNGSQFFITEVARKELDPNYTIFGRCKETDIVKAITNTPRDGSDKPNTPVVIKKLTIGKG